MIGDRKKAIGAFLMASVALALIFTAYSARAYTLEPKTSLPTYTTLYREEGKLEHVGYFSNESVYRNRTHLEYYPEKITQVIDGNYSYRTTTGGGHYVVTIHRDYYVTSGKVRVSLLNETETIEEGNFKDSFSIPVRIDLSVIDAELERIKDGTGLYRAQVDVYVVVDVKSNAGQFTQRIDLKRDVTGMLYLSGVTKEYKKVTRSVNTTINHVSFFGSDVGVSTARTVFPAMALLFAIPPVGFMYAKREKEPRKKDELKGLRKYIVEGTPSSARHKVEVSSPKDMERVFELVDKPVIHYGDDEADVYAIVDGDTVYEYRAS